ncbi:MAG: NYN domain-containing protein [Defluviitaleaceae bacterium]|nr:NYN domain-containing protein [Defluviitaleaceae bacterium]MCL2239759.1 NYN domain-containing protein [Defluviitaleaceae bacterium]
MAHYLLVDGYNIIHADEALTRMAGDSLETARLKLCDLLCEFKALSMYRIIVVFDAHLVSGGIGSVTDYYTIKVVFTKEAETADHYIERAAYTMARARADKVTVATSDVLEQMIILGQGARKLSADALLTEIEAAREKMRVRFLQHRPVKNNPFIGLVDEKTAQLLEEMRYDKPKG